MKQYNFKYLIGDFETTVYKEQKATEVWASACVELFTEDVKIFHSIDDTFDYLISLDSNIIIYYHNLKFDGSFWLSYLLTDLEFTQAFDYFKETETNIDAKFMDTFHMPNASFIYSISDRGQWYSITIKYNNHIIDIRDSTKLLPFSVKKIGKSFGTKHKKLDMEYKGFRFSGCKITDEEKEYIANDVLVVKEAMEILYTQGHNKLTIGACCFAEFKKEYGTKRFSELFPNLYDLPLDKDTYGVDNIGNYIRRSYRGGWCYLVKGKENKIYHNGTTADVNSLYPSMMSSESNNLYPVGFPTFWKGNFIPDEAYIKHEGEMNFPCLQYFFIRIKTRFYIKENYLPFIQAKNTFLYLGTESLETSDVYDPITKRYYDHYRSIDGEIKDTRMTLTLTMTDYQLLKEHYELVDFEILDGCYFRSAKGLFDDYMEKYKRIKMTSTGAIRELAKLFLNSLYGKMATSTDSSFKVAFVKEDTSIGFKSVKANDKKPGYIPVGSAITSYARNFTIRAAQKNYHGKDKPGFIYADTDSIHYDLPPDQLVGITVHDTDFCCWKLESCWDEAIFTRQKTYIEHITHENLKPIDKPYYNVKCAGMPDHCKELFLKSLNATVEQLSDYQKDETLSDEDKDFLKESRTLQDFKVGLMIPGKLIPKRIPGGVLLTETTYEMR